MRTKFCIILSIIIFTCSSLFASDYYIREAATGNGSGQDWTNSFVKLPSSLVRGSTYWFADGSYPTFTITPISGTSKIILKKATVMNHGTDTGWQNSYGDGQAVITGAIQVWTNNITIDGSERISMKTGHGFKIYVPNESIGIRLNNGGTNYASDFQIKYCEVQGNTSIHGDGIYWGGNNITMQYCYFHDWGRTHILTRYENNLLIEYNYFARNLSSPESHGEPYSDMGSTNVVIRYNIIEDAEGTAVVFTRTDPNSTIIDSWAIYGNVVWWTPEYSGEGVSGGFWFSSRMTNTRIYNNTFYNGRGLYQGVIVYSDGLDVDVLSYNNLWWNCVNAQRIGNYGNGYYSDYNLFYNSRHSSELHEQNWTGSTIFENPAEGNLRLNQATAGGYKLSSPYDKDPDNNSRGIDQVWDHGAYEYNVSIINIPTAPRNLRISQ